MKTIWGGLVQDDEEARNMWARTLSNVPVYLIEEAMHKLPDTDSKFPWTMGQFKGFCLHQVQAEIRRQIIAAIGGQPITLPVAYYIWQTRDLADWARLSTNQFDSIIKQELMHAEWDVSIPQRTDAPQIQHQPSSKDVGRKKIADIKKEMGW